MLRRLASGAALAAVAAVALVGCTPPEPTETTPAPTTTSASVDEGQVLEAARASWDQYQARLSEIGANPGVATIDPLLEVAERPHAEFLLANFARAADAHVHSEGARVTTNFQPVDLTSAPEGLLMAICIDVSGERLIGDEGGDLTPPDRDTTQSLSVEFSILANQGYLVANVENYPSETETDPCA